MKGKEKQLDKKFNKIFKPGKGIFKLIKSRVRFFIQEINRFKIRNKTGLLRINLDGKLNQNSYYEDLGESIIHLLLNNNNDIFSILNQNF